MTTQEQNIAYNNQAYGYITDHFSQPERTNVLVLGDSFAADFVNVLLESPSTANAEIVYNRQIFSCFDWASSPKWSPLWSDADVLILANDLYERPDCFASDIAKAESAGKHIFFVGSKDFGFNLNWLARLPGANRALQTNAQATDVLKYETYLRSHIPAANYLSVLDALSNAGRVAVTDESGRILSFDGRHLTRPGAIWLGARMLPGSPLASLLSAPSVDAAALLDPEP